MTLRHRNTGYRALHRPLRARHPAAPEYQDIEPYIVRYEHDPRQAAQLVESLGYRRGPDGLLRDAANQRLGVEISSIEAADNQKAMFATADAWQRLGIAAEPALIPPQRSQNREYRAPFPSFTVNPIPGILNDLPSIHSSQTPVPENGSQEGILLGTANPEFDGLLEQYLATIPKRQRNEALGRVVHHMTDQVVAMGVLHRVEPRAIATRMVNVSPGNRPGTSTSGTSRDRRLV